MGSTQQVVKTILGMVGTMGLGIALWVGMTPNEEQMKLRAKELPRSSPQQQAEQRQLNAAVMAVLKEAAETNENVARRPWPWKK
ncbi:PREDICTED: ubiquinol-cytochrome-c reductase complex assembly factor 3-like [Gekko japonicus]|uniref:Ubiquinol-cytochrome-c reductase complex assembly factor 3 n=1 Tax=Gekko japonicus TaxID=146911 RepID=A0ABM1K7A6_GEKJA|nr:PREDICTED: ubiquinol-cytochrome-c reductase complex assembly factor 3-like [Gekko japonicus]